MLQQPIDERNASYDEKANKSFLSRNKKSTMHNIQKGPFISSIKTELETRATYSDVNILGVKNINMVNNMTPFI